MVTLDSPFPQLPVLIYFLAALLPNLFAMALLRVAFSMEFLCMPLHLSCFTEEELI